MADAQTALVDVDTLVPHPDNPKGHDLDQLAVSIRRLGFLDPLVVDMRTGLLIAGHGRREALQAMKKAGEDPPAGVAVDDGGGWQVPVYQGWRSADDNEAAAALIALNRLTETGGWQTGPLVDLLDRLAELDGGMDGVGYDSDALDELRRRLEGLGADLDDLADHYGDPDGNRALRGSPTARPA